jgi:hypothetical protein
MRISVNMSRIGFTILAMQFAVCGAMGAAADTLVVCPAEFRAALAPWEAFRRSQGHKLAIIDVPRDSAAIRETVRSHAAKGRLKFLLLIGDAPAGSSNGGETIPTNQVPARINARWGGRSTITTDIPYADVDDDGAPDLAVGRIPVSSSDELAAVVRKILRYETNVDRQPWERRLSAVAGTGGFGAVADALIEAAGNQLIYRALPAGYVLELTRLPSVGLPLGSPQRRPPYVPASALAPLRSRLSEGSLVWFYMGHADRTSLDFVAGPKGPEPILSVDDVAQLRCGDRCPLAVLVACDTGAFEGPTDSLAEKLILAEETPAAVIASTGVSMPYGNAVFGYELMRASLTDRPPTLGEAFLLAQRRTLEATPRDGPRESIDALAAKIVPVLPRSASGWKLEELVTERQEHVAMYHLLGDPLFTWRRPRPMAISTDPEAVPGSTIKVHGVADFDGKFLVELARQGAGADRKPIVAVTEDLRAGKFDVALPVPAGSGAFLAVRAFLRGKDESAVGGTTVKIRAIEP